MKIKQKYKLICECQKEIVGFSKHHAEKNLELHKIISQEHKERMELIKNFPEIIITKNMSINQIADLLESNPIIIEDIKSIGGKYEKEIMVS